METSKELLKKGLAMLNSGNAADAVFCFEDMLEASKRSPISLSCLGLAMAKANLDLETAENFCLEAIKKSPHIAEFYRNLAEVYNIAGKKEEAIKTLKDGLSLDSDNKGINGILREFGIRKEPAVPFLSRSSFINKYTGLILSKLTH